MNAGTVEQSGYPLDIYEKPASIFVASFIGAPPMNLLPAGRGGVSPVSGAPAGAATIGFRPEDADLAHSGETPADALALDADVEAVEPVGAESFLYCAAAGSRIVVRVSGRAVAQPGDRLRVVARADKLHWFDSTGKRTG
jgi:sn-glycerol 3-phosphate transport system ATP-binding protein